MSLARAKRVWDMFPSWKISWKTRFSDSDRTAIEAAGTRVQTPIPIMLRVG